MDEAMQKLLDDLESDFDDHDAQLYAAAIIRGFLHKEIKALKSMRELELALAEERQEHKATLALAATMREAAKALYEETADYIRINNLGPVHHNRSMQMMRDALERYYGSEASQP